MTIKQGLCETLYVETVIASKGKYYIGYALSEALKECLEFYAISQSTGLGTLLTGMGLSTPAILNLNENVNGENEMQNHEMDAVREVIEALVAELGVDNVPAEIDVDGAIALLTYTEIEDATEEENANAAMEASVEVVPETEAV